MTEFGRAAYRAGKEGQSETAAADLAIQRGAEHIAERRAVDELLHDLERPRGNS